MDATLNDDQRLIQRTASDVANDLGCPLPVSLPTTRDDSAGWATLATAGFLGMHLPDSVGGGSAHSSDTALVAEQFARRTCLVPFLGQGVIAPELAQLARAPEEILGAMVNGSARVTVALSPDLRGLGRLGEEAVAWDARGAQSALALSSDDRLALVPLGDDVLPSADLTRVLRPISATATGAPIGEPIPAETRRRWEAFTLAMISAELVGVMNSALDAAIEYAKSRSQFGTTIGTFQAVQHLAADAKVLLEGSRSAMWHAAWAADELEPDEAMLASLHAKAYAASAALDVVEISVQLMGGIAITWEERAHLRVRRVLLDRLLFGDDGTLLDAIAGIRLGAAA